MTALKGHFYFTIALLFFLASIGQNADAQELANAGFEKAISGPTAVPGWEILADGHLVELDRQVKREGQSSLKVSSSERPRGTMVRQVFDGVFLHQRAFRLTGQARTDNVQGTATLVVIVNGPSGRLFVDDMRDRPAQGTTGWQELEIIVPRLAEAETVVVGALMIGSGTAWFDSFAVEPIDLDDEISGSAQAYLNEALDIMKQHSINREKIEWSVFRDRVEVIAAGAQTAEDTYPAIRYAVSQLGDKHSSFVVDQRTTPPTDTRPTPNPPDRMITGRVIANYFGYIEVPTFQNRGDVARATQFVDAGHRVIREIDKSGVCGWIVDLRTNTGGNMWPMLAAVGPLVGDGKVGAHVEKGSDSRAGWWYRDGRAGIKNADGKNVTRASGSTKPPRLKIPRSPVALLTSSMTSSSGEAIVIAFAGREDSIRIGGPTGGLATANAAISLSNGALLVLTIGHMADRNGQVYPGRIQPDIIAEDDRDRTDTDAALVAAKRWLSGQAMCANRSIR